MFGMERYFNIGGPCLPALHYMLPALSRLPDVASFIRKSQYFVVHAPCQCGKTTAFLVLANDMNARDDAVAVYCSLEAVQEFPAALEGVPKICARLRLDVHNTPMLRDLADNSWPIGNK